MIELNHNLNRFSQKNRFRQKKILGYMIISSDGQKKSANTLLEKLKIKKYKFLDDSKRVVIWREMVAQQLKQITNCSSERLKIGLYVTAKHVNYTTGTL